MTWPVSRELNKTSAIRLGGLLIVSLGLAACQLPVPQPAPPPRLLPDPSVNVAGVSVSSNQSATPASATYTIKRDTLRDSLTLTGRVVPNRSAQLTFRGNGTVTAVNVTSGQTVSKGEVLAQFALDDDSLQAARAQATLAQLAFESEQEKLKQLQSPANNDTVQQLRVTIEQDQANIQKLGQEQAATEATNKRAQKAIETAQSGADRKVASAEAGLKSAKDAVAKAQANLQRAQEDAQADLHQVSSDAASAASSASSAVRAAARQLEEANARLDDAKAQPAATALSAQIETQQFKVDTDQDMLKDAQADAAGAATQSPSTDHTARQIAAEVGAAKANVKTIERSLAGDKLELKHLQANLDGAKRKDAADLRTATYMVEASKEQLANAQQLEQASQQKAQATAKQADAKTPTRAGQLVIEQAQATLQQAEANVQAAQLALDDAHAAQDAAGDATEPDAQFADHALTAARIQLSTDQARLATLQGAAGATEIEREQTRVNLLRDQAAAAAAAAQPVVSLAAPFDGTIAEVGITSGQALVNGTIPADGSATDGRPAAVRLVASGSNSIVADVAESDVGQLTTGEGMDLTFPGLPGQTAHGTISDVGSTATVKGSQTTYPVRVQIDAMPQGVKLGMTAQASLAVAEAKDVLVAPRRAVRTFGGQTLVDKVDQNAQVQAVPVQVGRTFGTNVELLGGVQEGDVVAVYDGVTPGASTQSNR